MITPEGIREKALRQFNRYLLWLLDTITESRKTNLAAQGPADVPDVVPVAPADELADEPADGLLEFSGKSPCSGFFPLVIPSDRGSTGDDYFERKKGIELLWRNSKHTTGKGYSLVTGVLQTRKLGEQTSIESVYFGSESDYLSFTGRSSESQNFNINTAVLLENFPFCKKWIAANTGLVSASRASSYWTHICICVQWFIENPSSGLYLREIPLPVHTKFIEENKTVITSLVIFIQSLERNKLDAESGTIVEDGLVSFEKRFSLREAESLIRCRSLDPLLSFFLGLGSEKEAVSCMEMQLTVSDFSHLRLSDIKTVFVIENLMVYLTFPKISNGLCLFGGGFGAARIGVCEWLKTVRLFYFGDLDEHGFEILSDFRRMFPHTVSFCMDTETLFFHEEYRVPGKPSRRLKSLALLTKEEEITLDNLQKNPEKGRMEQERISLKYIRKRLIPVSETIL